MLVMYRLFTVALVALHLILFYVLAVGTGGILGRQFFRFSHAFKLANGVAFTGVFISNFAWQACILTLWEKQLCEKQAAGSAYGGIFVDHYLPFMSSFIGGYGLRILAAGAIAEFECSLVKTLRNR